jgi:hypothetical protein
LEKEFNVTGTCIPEMHYMVDTSNKIDLVIKLIEKGKYFVINRPRQYGKTTTLYMLERTFAKKEDYLVISISFEGIGDLVFESEERFARAFIGIIADSLFFQSESLANYLEDEKYNLKSFNELSRFLTKFIRKTNKKVILLIDEVDKSSNNQLFLSFLGMLRNKYLLRNTGKDVTFHSVILAGVHDVKSLKAKIRPDEEQKYNSPWNIATDFDVDMSFSKEEIITMIDEYCRCNKITMDTEAISNELHFFTSGYPYLVSRICKIVDEKINKGCKKAWTIDDIRNAVKIINEEVNTLFESIVKNLENSNELYELVKRILIDSEQIVFNPLDPLISIGLTYGLLKKGKEGLEISNKIFEEIIYSYMISKIRTSSKNISLYNNKSSFINENGQLNIEKVLKRFMQFMKEQYSSKDNQFLEQQGRLLFLAFIKPIINGTGFEFKEVQVSEEKRLDVVITYNNYKYIIELKIWRGAKYHEEGINQLCDYLEIQSLEKGYLVIFNFNKNKEFKEEKITARNKDIFAVYV